MFDSFYILKKLNDPTSDAVRAVMNIIELSSQEGCVRLISDIHEISSSTLIIAIGGDGTMIEAMKIAHAYGGFVIGINLGKIGFLTDSELIPTRPKFSRLIQDMINGRDMTVDHRYLLRTTILSSSPHQISTTFLSCNEVAISAGHNSTIIEYETVIDGHNVGSHRASGILVSTPTGSTAYSLSLGGSIMSPSMNAFQIIANAPATLSSRPLILDGNSCVEIHAIGKSLSLRSDGRLLYEVQPLNELCIITSLCQTPVRVVRHTKSSFLDTLTFKLGWQQ
jgi:NAD+ kinase